MDIFNSFINDTVMIEVVREDSRFTWSNKQENPSRSNLYIYFISREWEHKYPKVRVSLL
jgi:hypothetical protein